MKNTKIVLLCGILHISSLLSAQNMNFEWAKSIGGNNYDYARSTTVDNYGNVYTVGTYSNTVDFDPSSTSSYTLSASSGNDIFIQKLDSNGNFIWAKSFGGTNNDEVSSIQIDNNGDLVIMGDLRGTMDFDPGASTNYLTSNGISDVFVQKLDHNGNFLWVKSFGGTGDEEGKEIGIDKSGNIYTVGYFNDTVDFNPNSGTHNLSSHGSWDIFIQKMDVNGNFVWAKSIGSSAIEVANDVAIDMNGNIFFTGIFNDTLDFDPDTSTNIQYTVGNSDAFVEKLDSNGNFVWVKTFGGSSYDQGKYLCVDNSNNVITTGTFRGTVDFNPDSASSNLTGRYFDDNVFIQKLDNDGTFIWSRVLVGTNDVGVADVATDNNDNIYTGGTFSHTTDFNSDTGVYNITSTGDWDIFIHKLKWDGTFLEVSTFGGSSTDAISSLEVTPDKDIYSTGSFRYTADFDPDTGTYNMTALGFSGSPDVFVHKLNQTCTTTIGTDIQTVCGTYTWINGITYTSNNNTATDTLVNSIGCDSIITLNLTISSPTSSTDTQTACGTYTWINGITYTTSTTATDTLTNSAGCDSVITLDLTITAIDKGVNNNNGTLTTVENGATYQWIDCNTSTPITGATTQTFTPTANGEYAVEIDKNGCSERSDCISFSINGLYDHKEANITIFPNPSSGIINITSSVQFNNVEVMDITGKTLLTDHKNTLDISRFEKGIYFLKINADEGTVIKKIVKE